MPYEKQLNMHERRGMGSSGNCVCIKCGYTATKKPGVPCREERCPKCGTALLREGGAHYSAAMTAMKKKKEKEV